MIGYKILYQKQKKRTEKRERRIERLQNDLRRIKKQYDVMKRSFYRAARDRDALSDGYVVEWCVYCNRQVTFLWNQEQDGLMSFCPRCGNLLMICEKCDGECDYDYGFHRCRHMKCKK